jgi:predicted DCC family thiol-disulfide oxidoreductase YuxK
MTLPVLIFDGDCSFCTASANWVAARRLVGDRRSAACRA